MPGHWPPTQAWGWPVAGQGWPQTPEVVRDEQGYRQQARQGVGVVVHMPLEVQPRQGPAPQPGQGHGVHVLQGWGQRRALALHALQEGAVRSHQLGHCTSIAALFSECAMFKVHYALCNVQCTVCSVQCALCIVQCVVCSTWKNMKK